MHVMRRRGFAIQALALLLGLVLLLTAEVFALAMTARWFGIVLFPMN
jgi:hypothetical protein